MLNINISHKVEHNFSLKYDILIWGGRNEKIFICYWSSMFTCFNWMWKKRRKKLVCTQKVSSSGVEVNVDMLADFKGDNLDYLGLKYTVDLSEYNDVQIDQLLNKICVQ